MDDIRQLLLAAFDAEHREHLAAIRAALAAAEAGRPADWNDVFRRAHSLKGAARAVDLPAVEEIAHRLEALFDRVVQGRTGLDRATAGVVELALDRIEGLVAGLAETPEPAAPADAIAALDACLSGAPVPSAEPASRPEPEPRPEPKPAPEPHDGAISYLRIASDQVESLSKAVHDLTAVLQGQEAIGGAVTGLESGARALRRSVDTVQGRTGEMVALARRLREAGDPAGIALDGFVDRVRRLDGDLRAVIRGISGLARVQSRSTGAVDTALRRLRDDADRLLLVPAETVFGGYGRMVREIAREAGLPIEVRLNGLDLQVDRGLLQALKDPVLHALRNTISHGAETPEARRSAGKPEALSVTLSVASKGSQLVVTIRDDGRGPDLARILETGRRQGLVAPGPEPGPDEILDLVFAPGFSTATAVDRIAGRGMGLSVVAEAARSLRGRASLRPAEPSGTDVVITVPLSAARQPVLLVEAALRPGEAPQTFGLPSGAVAGLLRLTERDLASVAGEPAARIKQGGRDVVVPLVPLASLLGSGVAPLPLRDGLVRAVLLRCGPALSAVAVDRLLDVRVLLVGPAPPFGGDPALMSGTVMLADEMPALVLDRKACAPGREPAGWWRPPPRASRSAARSACRPCWWSTIRSPPGPWRRASWRPTATGSSSASTGRTPSTACAGMGRTSTSWSPTWRCRASTGSACSRRSRPIRA